MTLQELKARGYELIVLINQANQELNQISNEIEKEINNSKTTDKTEVIETK